MDILSMYINALKRLWFIDPITDIIAIRFIVAYITNI